ncbi:ABC transporter ATP-binding protein YtrB [Oxobacter pfennigii]|uniref:ABC transporter ATP-binding protein YtrB n=1 Tax=Oxobacter pfennigii TaxID=36849 RepID=A0A0P8YRY2_9CLOT|nr:ABC transporter ATP-binding protein [Oxobacter pfennigii]KPU42378.1 ABC transporter ATP-binding protein YtrB [Oxobacter pfennigii]
MISAKNVTKYFDDIKAIDDVTAVIKEGSVFGLIGSNGAGKSTFLRMLSGVIKPDRGEITIDGENVFENIKVKERFFYISDEQYFFPNTTPKALKEYYKNIYKNFDSKRFDSLMKGFNLDENRKINTFSKGMKKQVSVICAVSSMTDYIFCDETFDGLDPVVRQAVKSIFAGDMEDRGLTPVIASHNLRELEDICDHIGLLHRGGILLSKDLEDMKLGIHKIQCVFTQSKTREDFSDIEILSFEKRGSLYTITARGKREELTLRIQKEETIFFELLPLSLEEIFISETEVRGYDIKKLIF